MKEKIEEDIKYCVNFIIEKLKNSLKNKEDIQKEIIKSGQASYSIKIESATADFIGTVNLKENKKR